MKIQKYLSFLQWPRGRAWVVRHFILPPAISRPTIHNPTSRQCFVFFCRKHQQLGSWMWVAHIWKKLHPLPPAQGCQEKRKEKKKEWTAIEAFRMSRPATVAAASERTTAGTHTHRERDRHTHTKAGEGERWGKTESIIRYIKKTCAYVCCKRFPFLFFSGLENWQQLSIPFLVSPPPARRAFANTTLGSFVILCCGF